MSSLTTRHCPHCDAVVHPSATFCDQCGGSLTPSVDTTRLLQRKQPSARGGSVLMWIITLVVIGVLGGLGWVLWTQISQRSATIALRATPIVPTVMPATAAPIVSACLVPDVVGQDQGAAEGLIAGAGLQPVKNTTYDAGVPVGQVISQDPPSGTKVSPCKGEVEIVTSLGVIPEPTTSPPTTIPSPPAILASPSPMPGQVCNTWDVSSDFRKWPDQENPNRDGCGNLQTWHFMSSANLDRDPSTYYLFTDFLRDSHDTIGNLQWHNPNAEWPGVYFYTHQPDQKDIRIHADQSKLVILGWRSPFTGNIAITGSVVKENTTCGDGINWYIGRENTELAAGSIESDGGQDFRQGLGGDRLADISINQDEFIYLSFHPKGDMHCDLCENRE